MAAPAPNAPTRAVQDRGGDRDTAGCSWLSCLAFVCTVCNGCATSSSSSASSGSSSTLKCDNGNDLPRRSRSTRGDGSVDRYRSNISGRCSPVEFNLVALVGRATVRNSRFWALVFDASGSANISRLSTETLRNVEDTDVLLGDIGRSCSIVGGTGSGVHEETNDCVRPTLDGNLHGLARRVGSSSGRNLESCVRRSTVCSADDSWVDGTFRRTSR
ncbi:hypothetical protein BC832DRAFT_272193 [Gaertneriomyces semiglobifer]|nr:hypothetical protein BC832DRAFT_272193 [Gaertneriomyces semiglobifer]